MMVRVSDSRKNSLWAFGSQFFSAVQSSLLPARLERVAAITKNAAEMMTATINILSNDCFFMTL
jgi:hypothetical protein